MKVDILAIGVHPDDIELSCSGYLLKEIDKGKKVALLDLTWGELGTRGTGRLSTGRGQHRHRWPRPNRRHPSTTLLELTRVNSRLVPFFTASSSPLCCNSQNYARS